jgi:hypothetical protein
MRARLNSLLLAITCVAGVGCASQPAQEQPTASVDRACERASGNSLHLTSASSSDAPARDAEIDSILTQSTNDPRLERINRRMYLSLRSLDVELRREQRLAACEQPSMKNSTLEAQASNQSAAPSATVASSGSAASGVVPSDATASGVAAGSAGVTASALAGAGTSRALRKTSMSANGGGGNGATAPKIVPGSDNDIVLRRLRRAAEQETDPALRAKLWKEYTEYRLETSSK